MLFDYLLEYDFERPVEYLYTKIVDIDEYRYVTVTLNTKCKRISLSYVFEDEEFASVMFPFQAEPNNEEEFIKWLSDETNKFIELYKNI